MNDPPVALSIAGSDSGAGAGIQADIKTMAALGVFATTAVTAVTAQNTTSVREVHYVPTDMVDAQIDAVLDDLSVVSVKTGMLGTPAVVESVGRRAAEGGLPQLVVDPVMVASSGRIFLTPEGVEAYRTHLLPEALIATPNLWEASLLAGGTPSESDDVDSMIEMARRIHGLGPTWVLVKGGHLPGVESHDPGAAPVQVADVLFDGREVTVLTGAHVDTSNTHGTGCSLSSAIAAYLAHGADVTTAVTAAKEFVHGALLGGAEWHLGGGHGPLNHLGWKGEPPAGIRTRF
ncbi:MAG: bifunctional hydroxymethylpyrimidine kinase/phosphomethylpyrimidine kinase [Acidimicrobiales bacterium]|nr:bifunctional hydroxymethylpyrimidine kinase/phosphomethylpyrimidine kinase [Acidimicrobiales bacterium]